MSESINRPSDLPILRGDERFEGIDTTVQDFWRWGFRDLRLNVVRGILAEFLIATALEIEDEGPRIGFANYDLLYGNPYSIEVKSAARWQSWEQERPSRLIFGNLRRRRWNEETRSRRAEPEVLADIYIFARHSCDSPGDYDPLSTEQWRFAVLGGHEVNDLNKNSISAAALGAGSGWIRLGQLKRDVDRKIEVLPKS